MAVVSITALALALRLLGISRQSVWFDEAFSVGVAALPMPALLDAAAHDLNPPLYYLLLHAWLPLATNDAWLRLPGVLCSSATVGLTAWLGQRLFDWRTGLLAAVLLATSSFHIALSQEARAYALFGLLAMASVCALVQARARGTRRWWLTFAAVSVLALYSHNYGMFLLVAEATWLAGEMVWQRHLDRRACLAFLLIGVLYLPWVPVLLGQAGTSTWIERADVGAFAQTYFSFIASTPPGHGGDPLARAARWGILALLPLALLPARNRSLTLLLGSIVIGGTLLPVLLSMSIVPLFVVRYTAYVLPAFWLIVARAASTLPTRPLRAAVAGIIALEVVVNLPPLYTDPFYSRSDLRAAVEEVRSSAGADQLVIHTTEFTQYPFAYYDRGSLDDALIAAGDRASLRGVVADRPSFWYVASYDVQDPDAAASAEQQAGVDLCEWRITTRYDLLGVKLYQVGRPAIPDRPSCP